MGFTSRVLSWATVSCLTLFILPASINAQSVSVEIENLQPNDGFFFTPVWAGFHDGSFDFFDAGGTASAALELLAEEGDLKKIQKYFKNLLRDTKNKEYRDKIYYELAGFELKNGHLDEAIKNYKLSVQFSENNNRQKGHSYLSLGKIYYDSLNDPKRAGQSRR